MELPTETVNTPVCVTKLVNSVNHAKIYVPKPVLKWVGGKTQILDKLMVEFPEEIK